MEEEKFSLSGTFQKTKEYIDSQFKLVKLKTIERSSRLIASLVVDATKLIFTLFVLFFLCLALGFWLGELLGSYSLGFLATAGIFLVIIVLIRVFEPMLESKFMDLSIRRFLAKWNDEIEEEEEDLHKEKLDRERATNEQ
ncbi:hypothetical protein HS960_21710 [Sphingobacterium paramultivorum]|uniref:Phage holin family protein n=2 Tax=Sphingobacterium TaxID=28453 RepID=A0A7G5E7Y2_9SPHI|nr:MULTISPECIES: hypothetical protein [Sphingobacterium]QMV70107.1 hypothetical protein HS960_21710 [Sphingobacterium paramultivorum]WSO13945.1 hypothetical protein VUL84_21710 [Sphingobacterium paramultivorum]